MVPDDASYRRTLSELALVYELEPSTADVYVEGASDAHLIRWFLEASGRTDWSVKAIDVLDVPADVVLKHGLNVGARGRVLAAGLQLQGNVSSWAGRSPVFVADRDEEGVIGSIPSYGSLCLLTDFTSIELYGFDEAPLSKFLRAYANEAGLDAPTVLTSLERPLQQVFHLRLALKELEDGVGMIDDFERYCSVSRHEIKLDVAKLTQLIKSKSGIRSLDCTQIENRAKQIGMLATTDRRLVINGHDFVRLLTWLLRARRVSRDVANISAVGRALICCLERDFLAEFPLFQELLKRTG